MSEEKKRGGFVTIAKLENNSLNGDSGSGTEKTYTLTELSEFLANNKKKIITELSIKTTPGDREVILPSDLVSNISKLTVDARDEGNIDYSFLRLFSNLENLSLTGASKITSLSIISQCPVLEYLYCDSERITDVSSLGLCPKLKGLTLSNCKMLTNLSGLEGCTELVFLSLRNCLSLIDIRSIRNNMSLNIIFLNSIPRLGHNELEILSSCHNLEEVTLSRPGLINNLKIFSRCLKLRSLKINDFSTLTSLEGLQNCKNLQTLNISNCVIFDNVKILKFLVSLKKLGIEHCPVLSNIEPLSNLTIMTNLSLKGCVSITDIEALYSCLELTILNLESCTNLGNLTGLENHINLMNLNIDNCSTITDISALTSCSSLITLSKRKCLLLKNNANLDLKPGLTIYT
jgi:hypothetical protein